jgi:hypothetical protein
MHQFRMQKATRLTRPEIARSVRLNELTDRFIFASLPQFIILTPFRILSLTKAKQESLQHSSEWGGSMTTMTQLQARHRNRDTEFGEPAEERAAGHHLVGRLIQITLTFYLLPAFLVVLVVGGLGIVVLKIDRACKDLLEKRA